MTKIRSRRSSAIEDRRGRGGGGGFGIPGLGGGGGGLPFPTKAGGGLLGLVVLLAAMFLPKLLGATQAVETSGTSGSSDEPVECEEELEEILCGATDDVQAYWTTALPDAFGQPYQPTKTVFFSQQTSTGCGQATSQVGPFYCPLDGLVYFDLDFLVQLQEQFAATGDLAAQYIVAHEYGHHVQNVLGTSGDVSRRQQANPDEANALSIALELQADCYAGAWAADANRRGKFEAGEVVNEAINAAAAVGDDRIQQRTQGRIDRESWTHGSSEQRVQWFRRGFETGDPAQCTTFEEL